MRNLMTLVEVEFRRTWSKPFVLIILGVTALTFLVIFLVQSFFSVLSESQMTFKASLVLKSFMTFFSTVAALVITTGIIKFDVKNHWFRTILTRPVSRDEALLAKITSSFAGVTLISIFTCILPVIFMEVIAPDFMTFDTGAFLAVFVVYMLNVLGVILIATWFSCWAGGFFNLILVIVWMFVNNIVSGVIPPIIWDNRLLLIIVDFFYPESLADLAEQISGGNFSWELLLWGLATIAGFGGLAFWHFNKIKIDHGSD